MSSFQLLDAIDDAENNIRPTPSRRKLKNQHQSKKTSAILSPLALMDNVWHSVFMFFDTKTIFTTFAMIDRKRHEMVTGFFCCQSILLRDFKTLLDGTEEQPHQLLFDHYHTNSKAKYGLEPLNNVDTSNVFELVKKSSPFFNPNHQTQTFSLFLSLYTNLSNRRTYMLNRNMRIRKFFVRELPYGKKSYSMDTPNRRYLAMMSNSSHETIKYSNEGRAERKILECDHFTYNNI